MSCDNGESMIPLVETFLYRDTNGAQSSPVPALFSAESAVEKASKADNSVRFGQEDVARLLAEAQADGIAKGERQARVRFEEELGHERKRLAELTMEFQKQRADYYSRVETELVHLALAVAAKILHREAQVDRMVVAGLVKVMLERLQQNSNVIVRVRPEDAENWRHYFTGQANLQVVEDATLGPKACLLETELGVADMGLDAQLKEVEQGFFDLLARKPELK
jgi:flagellar assembly protein FliH